METILVTGGAGFIGSHLCDFLLQNGKKVVCVDNFNDYYSPKIKKKNIEHNLKNQNFILYKKDFSDFKSMKAIFEKHLPDKVAHLGARAGVRPSIENPFVYEESNLKGTLNLLELSKNKVKKFVFASSSSVYGRTSKVPFSEKDIVDRPVSPYAATKISGEHLCYTYSYLYNLDVVCLRFFTVYGPRGRPDMAPYLFTDLIYNDKPITVFGDGNSKRDYTYVDDVISGVYAALEKKFGFEVFNLGNSKTVKLSRLIEVIETNLGKKAQIIRKEIPKADVIQTYADISKSKKMLGYNPKTSIEEGMKRFTEWYLKR